MYIRDLMEGKGSGVISTGVHTSLAGAAALMNKNRIGALMVLGEHSEVAGIVTERDILKSYGSASADDEVRLIMTPAKDLLIIHDDDTIEYAMSIFTANKIRHLPVFSEEKLIGIISIGDTVKSVLSLQEAENKNLKDYISGGMYPVFE